MFNNLGWGEITALLVIALIVFGPDRLPQVAADAGRMIRQLRKMATGLTDDLKAELGPEIGDLDLASLHPKRFVEKALAEADEDSPRPAPRSGASRPAGAGANSRPGNFRRTTQTPPEETASMSRPRMTTPSPASGSIRRRRCRSGRCG